MKIGELTGAQLDYWVAKAEGRDVEIIDQGENPVSPRYYASLKPTGAVWWPSSKWAQGGPIIERERIAILPTLPTGWVAELKGPERHSYCNDDSPLVAAMRAYVGYKFGAEVPDQTEG